MAAMTRVAASLDGGIYTYRTQTAFDELDALWVLHHARFLRHLERAQQGLFDVVMQTECFDPERYPDVYVVVRRVEVDYLAPLRGVVPFQVRLRVERVREAALTVAFSFRSGDGAVVHARGLRTVCKLSGRTHEPTGWTREFRERYEDLRTGGAGAEL